MTHARPILPRAPQAQTDAIEALRTTGWFSADGRAAKQAWGLDDPDAWHAFAALWDNLLRDEYMRDGGTYRFRRYGAFAFDARANARTLLPHAPYEQSTEINRLNGGLVRHFEPLEAAFVASPVLDAVLAGLGQTFATVARHYTWTIRLHPYRIVARDGADGEPAPEGVHRDGVDFIVSLMIRRVNVTGGVSTVFDGSGSRLGSVELAEPGDVIAGDDRRTLHGFSPVKVADARKPFAHRDVLVIAFERR